MLDTVLNVFIGKRWYCWNRYLIDLIISKEIHCDGTMDSEVYQDFQNYTVSDHVVAVKIRDDLVP